MRCSGPLDLALGPETMLTPFSSKFPPTIQASEVSKPELAIQLTSATLGHPCLLLS